MDYLTAAEIADKWNVSSRMVAYYCKSGSGPMSIFWTKKVERLCCFLSSSSSFCCGVK